MPSFINAGYVRQILGWRGLFGTPHILEQPQKGPSLIGLTTSASAADTGIHKKILEPGKCPLELAFPKYIDTTTPIISNDKREDIIKIVKSLEGSALLVKGVSETIQNEVEE